MRGVYGVRRVKGASTGLVVMSPSSPGEYYSTGARDNISDMDYHDHYNIPPSEL